VVFGEYFLELYIFISPVTNSSIFLLTTPLLGAVLPQEIIGFFSIRVDGSQRESSVVGTYSFVYSHATSALISLRRFKDCVQQREPTSKTFWITLAHE